MSRSSGCRVDPSVNLGAGRDTYSRAFSPNAAYDTAGNVQVGQLTSVSNDDNRSLMIFNDLDGRLMNKDILRAGLQRSG